MPNNDTPLNNIYDIFLIYSTHAMNTQRRLQSVLDVTRNQENIMSQLMTLIINEYAEEDDEENINNLRNINVQGRNVWNRPVTRTYNTRYTNSGTNTGTNVGINRGLNLNTNTRATDATGATSATGATGTTGTTGILRSNIPSFSNPLRTNIPPTNIPSTNIPFSRNSIPYFPFPSASHNTQDRWNDIFTQLTTQRNEEFLTPVVVRPTEQQINRATRITTYSSIVAPNNTRCPISLVAFEDNSEVMQILECGHIFVKDELMNWFNMNVRCPLCRYDIRNYQSSERGFTNHDLSPINLQNSESFTSETLSNGTTSSSEVLTPRNTIPQSSPRINHTINPNSNRILSNRTISPQSRRNVNENNTTETQTNTVQNQTNTVQNQTNTVQNRTNTPNYTLMNNDEVNNMINNVQNTLLATFSNDGYTPNILNTEIGIVDNNGNYNIVHNSYTPYNNVSNTSVSTNNNDTSNDTPNNDTSNDTPNNDTNDNNTNNN